MSSENDIIATQDEMTAADVRKSMRVNVFTILTNILLVVLICAGLILTEFFRLDSYKFKIQSLNFWLEKLAFAFCTFGIMLGISNSADEISRSKNPEYLSDIMKLKEHYSLLLTEYNDENFKKYLYSLLKDDCHLKVYGQYILVISNSGIGVTLLRVPQKYRGRKSNGNIRCNKNPSDFTFREV